MFAPGYHLLRNHLYVGEIEHKGQIYAGEHEAIIERELWDRVQESLTEHRQGTRRRTRATKHSLLTGIVFDEQGNRYTPTHAIKNGRRYRYYTSQAVIRKTKDSTVVSRIPAHEVDYAVANRVAAFAANTNELLPALRELEVPDHEMSSIVESARRWAGAWEAAAAQRKEDFLRAALQRVVMQQDSLRIELRADAFLRAITGVKPSDAALGASQNIAEQTRTIALCCPLTRAHRGKEMKLIIGDQTSGATSTSALIKAVARARTWYERIVNGEAHSFADLGRQDGLTGDYVGKLFPCALLAPTSVEALLNQRQSPGLTVERLMTAVPISWKEQPQYLRS